MKKKVLYITPLAIHGIAEDKFLSLAKAGISLFDPLFVFVAKNPFQDILRREGINYHEVQGFIGLAKFLQKESYDAIHFYGPDKLVEIVATNARNNVNLIYTSFDRKVPNSKYLSKIKLTQDLIGSRDFIGLNRSLLKNYSLASHLNILVLAKSSDELDFESILGLAKHLKETKSNLKIKIHYEGELRASLKARLEGQHLANFVDFLGTRDFDFNNALCYLDFNSKSLKLELLEAAFKQIPIVARNNRENNILFQSKRLGFLFQDGKEIAGFLEACKNLDRSQLALSEEFLVESSLEYYSTLYFNKTIKLEKQSEKKDEPIYMVVPYSIYGGGEIYLKNHIEKGTFQNVHLVFLSPANQLLAQMKDKVGCSVINGIRELDLFLVQRAAKNVLFYNSGSVAKVLARLKGNLRLNIAEVVHSTLQWADSMHGIDRRFVDKIYVVAEMVARQWGLVRYEVLPAVVDEKKFKIAKRSSDKIVVGTVARFSPEKDLKRVVDVASCLDDNYKFVIVGKDGGTKKEVEDYIKFKRLSHRIELKDYREDIEQEYAGFDCFLLTSKIEGTPLTILEAKAASVPVVVPDVGAIKEMVRKGDGRVYNINESARNIAFYIKEVTKGKRASLEIDRGFPSVEISNRKYDLVIIADTDPMLYFHSCLMIAEMMAFLGKNVYTINKQDKFKNYKNELHILNQANNIILYRMSDFPEEVKRVQHRGIPVGYSIDDNIFFDPSSSIRSVIKQSNYCIANNETLTKALKDLNPNSFCVGPSTYWAELFTKKGIGLSEPNNDDGIRIGITYGPAHRTAVAGIVEDLCYNLKNINRKIEIVYFHDAPLAINFSSNITLELHPYTTGNDPFSWYRKLFSLRLDLVYVCFAEDSPIIRSKSNVKFRESSFMKIPLFALDTTEMIYKDWIKNGFNGYHMNDRVKLMNALKETILDKNELRRLGLNAYETLAGLTPDAVARKIWNIIEMQHTKEKKI